MKDKSEWEMESGKWKIECCAVSYMEQKKATRRLLFVVFYNFAMRQYLS